MSNKFSVLLFADPRAKTKARPEVCYTGNGWQITEFFGHEGWYWDVKFPEGEIPTMPYFSLYPSGGMEAIHEVQGVWYMADKEHPWGNKLNADGTPSEEKHLIRAAGRTRIFFKDDTHRMCIYPTDAFGSPSFDPIEFKHVKGPAEFFLPKNAMFTLASGVALIDGQVINPPYVVYAKTRDNVPVSMHPDSYGAISWKL